MVNHANKKAIFQLASRDDTFGIIKKKIADYFGLPPEKIFLSNSNKVLLLDKDRVIDELFPLQNARIRNISP